MGLNLLLIVIAIAVSVGIFMATGGSVIFFALPLLLGLPLLRRRR